MVPNLATWKAELAYVDLVDPRMEDAMKRAGEAMARVDAMIAWLGTDGLDGFADEQRIQIMRAIAAERVGDRADRADGSARRSRPSWTGSGSRSRRSSSGSDSR